MGGGAPSSSACDDAASFAYWADLTAAMRDGEGDLRLHDQYDYRVRIAPCTTGTAVAAELDQRFAARGFAVLAGDEAPGCRRYRRRGSATEDLARACVRITLYGTRCTFEMVGWAVHRESVAGEWRRAAIEDQSRLYREIPLPP